MQGQANVFFRYFPERLPAAIARYQKMRSKDCTACLTGIWRNNEWLAGEFSIADIANWCWCRIHNWAGVAVDDLPNLQRWMAAIAQRPGCAKGVREPHEINYNEPDEDNVGTFVNSMQSVLVR
jgi:glutathione S-transferase